MHVEIGDEVPDDLVDGTIFYVNSPLTWINFF